MKILSAEQIRILDKYTIEHEPVASVDLMERAAMSLAKELENRIGNDVSVMIFCGRGNNGGDGLVVARYLAHKLIKRVSVFVVKTKANPSKDFLINERRYTEVATIRYIENENDIPKIAANTVVVDALVGTGLNKPITGIFSSVVHAIHRSKAVIYAVDIPSGLYCDALNGLKDTVIKASEVFTFHAPKLSFLLPQNSQYVPKFTVLDIGLDKNYNAQLSSSYEYVTAKYVRHFFTPRLKFSHKGNYGHVLIAAGSFGKIGAAVLAVKAALCSGAGLVTALVPACGYDIMQNSNPEAMVLCSGDTHLYDVPDLISFSAAATGPGIGTETNVYGFMNSWLKMFHKPMVLDADAINMMAEHKKFLKQIPENSILTPHPGEFKRMVGSWKNDSEKLALQTAFSIKYKVIVVLKGAHTTISTPQGKMYFNSTGNPGMAKGGSGDVLTGVITSLMAQRYDPEIAAVLAVFIHGLAGDIAAEKYGQTAMRANDIVASLAEAFKFLEKPNA